MDDMPEAPITGDVLRWARERKSMTIGDLARRLHISESQLRDWEDELSQPPLGKAETLAQVLDVPFGFFFLSSRPKDESPIADYRTIRGRPPKHPSPQLLSAINYAITKQEWYRDFAEENASPRVPFVGAFNMRSDTLRIAESLAAALHINEATRRSVTTHAGYLSRLSEIAQDLGILVMRGGGKSKLNALSVGEVRGFALSDPYAPVVFLNSRDSHSAQVFTLLHELAHIWINRSGISNPDPTEYDDAENVELFCNRVAGQALISEADFLSAWDQVIDREFFPRRLSRTFWVSPLVIVVRAFELNKISDSEFVRLVIIEKNKSIPPPKRQAKGNPTAKVLARNSKRFTTTVLRALRSNRLVHQDAAWLLGIRRTGINALLTKFSAQ